MPPARVRAILWAQLTNTSVAAAGIAVDRSSQLNFNPSVRISPPAEHAPGASLLDPRLAWPVVQWKSGGPWRLGEGLCIIGRGWHRLVRQAFALVAELPGAWVVDVKQRSGQLDILARHDDPAVRTGVRRSMLQSLEASLITCAGCA